MDINVLKTQIMLNGYSNDQLNELGEAIKFARGQLVKQVRRQLGVGAPVEFTSGRDGVTYSGTVRKINIKYVVVDTQRGAYKVPASMLTVL
jgi:hypothetical protein